MLDADALTLLGRLLEPAASALSDKTTGNPGLEQSEIVRSELACNEIVRREMLRHAVLTPHPGEAARLLKCSTSYVQNDRYAAVQSLETFTGAHVILKGAATVIRSNGQGFVNGSGNPALAAPGSGDVLVGLIAGLIATLAATCKDTPLTSVLQSAARLGVYLHGRAADELILRTHGGPLIASDIIDELPRHLPLCFLPAPIVGMVL